MAGARTLGDRYEVRSTLGRGGMATVFEGVDLVLDRPVAIKVLAERYAGDEKFVARFQREARAAAGLSHANIVSVFDTGDTGGQHYIVMELFRGETLADLLAREGTLSAGHAAGIAGIVAQALQAAHDKGFVHRDVKPGNVMLSPSGEVKVMDFGIARAATDEALTQTGMVLGTASYLSPEQSKGDPVDHRSDIYSLGCVLYEMLTGRPPFSGGSPVSVAYRHVNEEPEPPSGVNPRVPAELESVVMRALRKDPEARFPTADAFREAVTAALGGEATEPLGGDTAVLPVATEQLEPPPGRKRRRFAPAAVAAVIAIAVIAALALTGDDRTARRGQRDRPHETPTTTDPTTPPPEIDVATATVAFEALVEQAATAGELDEELASEILDEVGKATEESSKGELEKAVEHLGRIETEVQVGLLEGTVASEETGELLLQGVATLRSAMSELPVTPITPTESPKEDGEDSGDSGPGNSENAPGQIKKKGDD
jgi:serine/threonine-protein kinase